MSELLLVPFIEGYRFLLQPVAPLSWFGLSFTYLDVAAAFRLCVGLRQLREHFHREHTKKVNTTTAKLPEVESRSFVRDASATLLVVYGGEAAAAAALGVPPSFMISGTVPAFYTVIQTIVESLPSVPFPQLTTELPTAVLDGFTRAFLLCTLIPPMVLEHPFPAVQDSPWTLLVTSFLIANGGFLLINAFSILQPYALTLTTPPELQPYGWTTTDLWCAPLVTALYAGLTHAQPFWAGAHAAALGWLGAGPVDTQAVEAVAPESARAACAAVLAVLFTTRAYKNYGAAEVKLPEEKKKVQ
ncbi:hypothetical protein CERSUDRAFT_117243 [Gelatoporia subvermispora B]|uniref:Uncharacterized protein n=1 Tax=Ceriporiopsis subvermispora (strain B) TaxID=914234 RepID=M2PER1_CERS8|nr:hypothetical protein CERSUDRAFT_117243 [Gelatoporia subvermispora B]